MKIKVCHIKIKVRGRFTTLNLEDGRGLKINDIWSPKNKQQKAKKIQNKKEIKKSKIRNQGNKKTSSTEN